MQQQLNDSPLVTDIDLLYIEGESKEKSSNVHSKYSVINIWNFR